MTHSLRFCIHSVTPAQAHRLESRDPPVRPHDCLGVCSLCFERPVIARGEALLDEAQTLALLADPPSPPGSSPG